MKSLACCITQSKTGLVSFLFAACILLACPCSLAQSDTPASDGTQSSAQPNAQAVVAANTLEREGARPFHLKLSVQIFDFQGKPLERGSVDYWWASESRAHLDLTLPSTGLVHNTEITDATTPAAARSMFLVDDLLNAYLTPGSRLPKTMVLAKDRTISTIRLQCFHAAPAKDPRLQKNDEICADVATGTIRLINTAGHTVDRNRVGTFAATHVALDVMSAWNDKTAVAGSIGELRSFDPATANVPLDSSPRNFGLWRQEKPSADQTPTIRKTSGPAPVYPDAARGQRIQGTVVFVAQITREGRVASLIPIASPDPTLTRAASNAVALWTYVPYLKDGIPTPIYTTITVNFNLR